VESPFWTLTVEVIFYAVLPFVMGAFLRRRWLWSLPLTVALTVTWLILIRWSAGPLVGLVQHHLGGQWLGADANYTRYFLWHQFPEHMVDFACGIVAANLDVRRSLKLDDAFTRRFTSRNAGIGYLVAGVVIVAVNMRLLGTYSLQNGFYDGISIITKHNHQAVIYYFCEEMPFGVGYGLILLGIACGPAIARRPLSFRWLTGVGVIGYSIYLIHMPMLYRLNLALYKGSFVSGDAFKHFLQLSIPGAIVILVLSTLFYHGVEKPFMIRGRSRSVPVPGPDAEPAGQSAPAAELTSANK
jgi:peptidoglycan/LPS O-acetylase OafA/YrhL